MPLDDPGNGTEVRGESIIAALGGRQDHVHERHNPFPYLAVINHRPVAADNSIPLHFLDVVPDGGAADREKL